MAHTLTAATPVSPADVAVAIAPSVPDGGDFRTAGSLYDAFQKILNLASVAAALITGGTIGDGTGAEVIFSNPVTTSRLTTTFDVNAGRNVNATQDANATRDVIAGRDVTAGRNLSAAGTFAVTGTTTLNSNQQLIGGTTEHDPLVFVSRGRIVPRVNSAAGVGARTASLTTASFYFFPTVSAGASIQIDDTGGIDGDTFEFASVNSVNVLAVKDPGGATIVNLRYVSGGFCAARVTRISGVWTLVYAVPVP